jgi:hypothetical protein
VNKQPRLTHPASRGLSIYTSVAALLLAAVLGRSYLAEAQSNVYRWVDAQGNLVMSDMPPPNGTVHETLGNTVTINPADAFDSTQDEDQSNKNSGLSENLTSSTDAEQDAFASSANNNERCAQAKNNLSALSEAGPVTVRNAQGMPRDLTTDEVQIQLQATRAQIAVYCDAPQANEQ